MAAFIIMTLLVSIFLSASPLMMETNVYEESFQAKSDKIPYNANELEKFLGWAAGHNIFLVGINKNADHFLSSSYNPSNDQANLDNISGILIVADALYKIPDEVLEVMSGKTIYFSTEVGRSYAIVSSFPEYGMLVGLERGLILEQEITSHSVLHELGHIVDYHGIQGAFNDYKNFFSELKPNKDKIFKVNEENTQSILKGYITLYSIENNDEDFAEHFASYVLYPDEFREKMKNDPLLEKKYKFFRDYIFSGIEY